MRCSKLLAFAGLATLACTSAPLTPSFKNSPADAEHTLDALASDALEITGLVRSMLDLIDNDAATSTRIISNSLAANIRTLVVRWFGEAALPENAVEEDGNDTHGFAYLKGIYTRMHSTLLSKPPTIHCNFHSSPCVRSSTVDLELTNGTTITAQVLKPTSILAYVSYFEPHEIHVCSRTLDKYNQTWAQTLTTLESQRPDYSSLHHSLEFKVLIHEMAHLKAVGRWKHIKDVRTSMVAAFKEQGLRPPRDTTYGPAAAQWLAAYAPHLAMKNADNFAGFSADVAFLSQSHMPPPWDRTLFGWPDGEKASARRSRSRIRTSNAKAIEADRSDVQTLWDETM